MAITKPTIHEVDFCSQIAGAVNQLVASDPAAYPFCEARVEGFGIGGSQKKRKDLRFYDARGKIVLCGEVKLPGTREGRSAMDHDLMTDAATKADNAGVQYFFTWNVNEFVLWDRSRWDRSWFERRVRPWALQRTLRTPQEVAREENLIFIKTHFLPNLLRDLGEIISGRRRDWGISPDDFFIHSLESHLEWPVLLTAAHILDETDKSKRFENNVERWMTAQDWTFTRKPHEVWSDLVDNMAKTLAYIWANRLIFYKALRARFPDLPRLEIRKSITKPEDALAALNRLFEKAVNRSGDYEPLLMPDAKDWATELVFDPPGAIDAWRGLLRGIESVDFREVPSDVVGRIFQKIIGPDERHRYGQHFTGDDVVDLINVFCVRSGADVILDPACGSGSFLVRAYYRKRHLDPARPHLDLIGELFGCDIALYPAHLATLNLAAREINDEANYPRISRRNFFDFKSEQPFCQIPDGEGNHTDVRLPYLDAVVGNPPYVRQESVEKKDKARYMQICAAAWPGLQLTGRSDLHCYFWPAAARLLKPNGYFGFLTSSSWMDVEYGFALQGWILRHFKILAVMESAAEPWFEDARVKTCVAILQRCDDEAARMANRVRFVRFAHRLSEIIGVKPSAEEESARQEALERLRKRILSANADFENKDLRIIVKTQADLWADGVRAGAVLGSGVIEEGPEESEEEDESNEAAAKVTVTLAPGDKADKAKDYRAGKWGRYVRAPDIYFDIMRRFASRFAALGEIASIRRGITSGCDAFFMPKDITAQMLQEYSSDHAFREHCGGAPRKDVESSKLRIIEAGDGSIHPIEAKYLAPEVHSLMNIDRPVVHATDFDKVVLLVNEPLDKLKAKSPWVWRYLRYGMDATFPSNKSKPGPMPKRATCAARDPWYDLTGLVKPGFALWPKSQQYRHIIPANTERVICNCNLYDVASGQLNAVEQTAFVAILNSTLVGLFKTFYGRFAGTEGNLKTEVVDVNLLEVPDPRGVSAPLAKRLANALASMSERPVGRLVEEQLMDCHTPERARRIALGPPVYSEELQQSDRRDLDDAIFELLGVSNKTERTKLIHRLYEATALHFRDIRVVEIEKMEQRSKSAGKRFSVHDLAADIWDAAELDDALPLAEWTSQRPESDSLVNIPEDRPVTLVDSPLFPDHTIYFGKQRTAVVECKSRGQAELVARIATLGVFDDVKVPAEDAACLRALADLNARLQKALTRFKTLAESRTSDERTRGQLMEVLQQWFVLGRGGKNSHSIL
ncbi:MAG: N-6 DNA methylase [Candidatus Sumerlaeota bacterium]|nr:N-6 DNA methylase [Candidatus Sumerlaeota bacterium]